MLRVLCLQIRNCDQVINFIPHTVALVRGWAGKKNWGKDYFALSTSRAGYLVAGLKTKEPWYAPISPKDPG